MINQTQKLLLFILFSGVIAVAGCSRKVEKFTLTGEKMGTVVSITVYHDDPRAARDAIKAAFSEIDRIEAALSKYRPDSEVSRLNKSGSIKPQKVSGELFSLISESKKYSRLTGGAFDITVGPLLAEWERARRDGGAPDPDSLAAAEKLVGADKIELNDSELSVRFNKPGMRIDLGAIAKGYAVDAAMAVIKDMGIESALIDAGGDILTIGHKPDGRQWTIAIRRPEDRSDLSSRLLLSDVAVTTSGNYERYVEYGGEKYSHLYDPRTGKSSDCVSATVIAPKAARADALSTSICVLGPVDGIELIETLDGIEALMIDAAGKTSVSSGFNRYLQE